MRSLLNYISKNLNFFSIDDDNENENEVNDDDEKN